MVDIYLGIGTNLGDKETNIRTCLQMLENRVGHIVKCSTFFYSKAEGFVSDNDFVNVAVHLRTSLTPLALLDITQAIECEMGRTQKSEHQLVNDESRIIHFDRIIDIDILYYGDLQQVFQDAKGQEILIIPHPRMTEREFVMIPLREIWTEKRTEKASVRKNNCRYIW